MIICNHCEPEVSLLCDDCHMWYQSISQARYQQMNAKDFEWVCPNCALDTMATASLLPRDLTINVAADDEDAEVVAGYDEYTEVDDYIVVGDVEFVLDEETKVEDGDVTVAGDYVTDGTYDVSDHVLTTPRLLTYEDTPRDYTINHVTPRYDEESVSVVYEITEGTTRKRGVSTRVCVCVCERTLCVIYT